MSGPSVSVPVGDLAGELVAAPGDAAAPLRSSRREWAPLLARGRPASALPSLLAAAYSLCGGAHALTASAAVAAARAASVTPPAAAWETSPSVAQRETLRADTLREHLRRIALDWPRVLAWPGGSPAVSWLAGSPAMQPAAEADTIRVWLERELLGEPAGSWLAQYDAAPEAFGAAWAREGRTPVARWLHEAGTQLAGLAVPLRALPAPLDAADMRELAEALRSEPAFALRPLWRGATAETGPWTRHSARRGSGEPADRLAACGAGHDVEDALEGDRAGGEEGGANASVNANYSGRGATAAKPLALIARLAARVAEVARLSSPGGSAWLAMGAAPVGPSEGLAWCEMARGLLVHWVRLAPGAGPAGPVIDTARVLAPTEWNFHPQGGLARLLGGLAADAPRQLVELAAAAFDPCVGLQVVRGTPAGEPACTR